jgi:hypothetical protein
LSYIPFARQMATRLFGRVMVQMEDVWKNKQEQNVYLSRDRN